VTKLNLGGGLNWQREGWENLDLEHGWDLEVRGLGSREPGTVAKIYTSHSLEHLKSEVAFRLLQECHLVLAPSSVMRVVVPDCEKFARSYLKGYFPFFTGNKFLTPHFSDLRDCFIGMGGGRDHGRIAHQWFWDTWTMTWALATAGFERIQVVDFRQGDEEMRDFDNPDTQLISCYLEAFKGSS
jgi:predicted SAM-dependent methyltransferase